MYVHPQYFEIKLKNETDLIIYEMVECLINLNLKKIL